jgi:hypothetical protein
MVGLDRHAPFSVLLPGTAGTRQAAVPHCRSCDWNGGPPPVLPFDGEKLPSRVSGTLGPVGEAFGGQGPLQGVRLRFGDHSTDEIPDGIQEIYLRTLRLLILQEGTVFG